jgi:hypothetical protein
MYEDLSKSGGKDAIVLPHWQLEINP